MDISPDKQNLDAVFSNTTYYIDFYQREYKWNDEPVQRLLDDIFFKFNQEYEQNKNLDPGKEIITEKYSWYYLNTYVTNTISGKVYVVDGQQRLTTLSLILIKMYHLAQQHQSKLMDWLRTKVVGHSGFNNEFWMNHNHHRPVQEALFSGNEDLKQIDVSDGITAKNLVNNYAVISKWLEAELTDKHKFETFAFYLLHRIVMINLSVEQTDVPMVFEVINDRGVRLNPHEILKGKLLGQIEKLELENDGYNELWEKQVRLINDVIEDEIDEFFRYYLKSKFAGTRKEGQKFDGAYHREIFDDGVNGSLKLKHNPKRVKEFLKGEFYYYTQLFYKVLKYYTTFHPEYSHVFFNKLNDLDSQFLLILSACRINDPDEDEKIRIVSYEVDRLFSLLALQNVYDSNAFQETIFKISDAIREKEISEYRAVFDTHLVNEIKTKRSLTANQPLQYTFFKNSGINLNMRFKRYFFARIENFLAENLNLRLKHLIEDLVTRTGVRTGFHIEHILSHNKENLKLFNNDEDLFEQERNRLGGILLLKGRDNISSSNESYSKKLKSYANTLYWNETLRKDSYKSKLDITDFKNKYRLHLEPYDSFGPQELENRQKLLFEMVKIIWK